MAAVGAPQLSFGVLLTQQRPANLAVGADVGVNGLWPRGRDRKLREWGSQGEGGVNDETAGKGKRILGHGPWGDPRWGRHGLTKNRTW